MTPLERARRITLRAALLQLWCAIAGVATLRHWYLSTSCLHGDCAYCQTEARRYDGTHKTAATCKTCRAPCQHRCHRTRPTHPENDLG